MKNFDLLAKINPSMVYKHLPISVLVTDLYGNIIWVNDNAAVLFEGTKGILKSKNIDDIVINGLDSVKSAVSKEDPVATAAISITEQEFFVEINAVEVDEKYYITISDTTTITNFLSTAEKSGRLNKDKNQMIYKLATELKSPIQSIQGFSKALLDGMGGALTDKQAKYARIINKNAVDYAYFLDKFIEFAQTESMCVPLNLQIFDVINSIQNLIKINEHLFEMKNIKVNFDAEDITKRAIYSDEGLVKIILQNIIEASVKLTDLGLIDIKLTYPDLVEVRQSGINVKETAKDTDYLKISVIDTGVGYTESDLEDLWEPYVHINRSNRKNLVRTFGLGSVQNAVKALGGSWSVRSEVMQGCIITVILPIEKD